MRISMEELETAFHKVRKELLEIGLLDDGVYLDQIECCRALLPALWGELGFVFDKGVGLLPGFAGFKPGIIYIPSFARVKMYVPGGTLVDTIRHEFAHAWYWLEPRFVDANWFPKAFGGRYIEELEVSPNFDRDHFVSEYATTSPAEDFAETFMYFLRYRNSLHRFKKRRGLYKKLMAVARTVRRARKELSL